MFVFGDDNSVNITDIFLIFYCWIWTVIGVFWIVVIYQVHILQMSSPSLWIVFSLFRPYLSQSKYLYSQSSAYDSFFYWTVFGVTFTISLANTCLTKFSHALLSNSSSVFYFQICDSFWIKFVEGVWSIWIHFFHLWTAWH